MNICSTKNSSVNLKGPDNPFTNYLGTEIYYDGSAYYAYVNGFNIRDKRLDQVLQAIEDILGDAD